MRRLVLFALPLSLACTPSRSSTDAAASATTAGSDGNASATESAELGSSESGATSEAGPETESGETETGEDTGLSECPEVDAPQSQGTVSASEIDEASGMVRSRTQELLWVHNDSGDSARLFALGLDGSLIAEVQLAGAGAVDWEDMALGPGPEPGDHLYVGDIGDNAEARPDIAIYRLPEPANVAQLGPDPLVVNDWEALQLSYPDGPHNAETLLVDPLSGDLFIVTKGNQTLLYRLAAPLKSGELEQLPDPNYPSAITTAGEVSPLGDFVIVRGYFDAFAWLRAPGQTIGEAMLGEPCPIPLANEPQGETLAIDADGRAYFTLSESTNQPLWRFDFGP